MKLRFQTGQLVLVAMLLSQDLLAQRAGSYFSRAAEVLEKNQLYHSAMRARIEAVRQGGYTPRDLAKIGEASLILDRQDSVASLGNFLRTQLNPTRWPTELRTALAGIQMRAGNASQAMAWLPSLDQISQIPSDQARFRALHIASSIYYLQGRYDLAIDTLRPTLGKTPAFDSGLSRLQRARIFYESGKNVEAMEELAKIRKSSPSWFSGVQVASWSAYRLKDYNLALGQMMSLHNPFLVYKFSPETHILQSEVLYKLCYYESSLKSLELLRKYYGNFVGSIQKLRRSMGNQNTLVGAVVNYARGQSGPSSEYPAKHWDMLMDGIMRNEVVAQIDKSLLQIKREEERVASTGKDSNLYRQELAAARREAYRKGLQAAMYRLNQMEAETRDSLEAALAIEVEVNTRIRDRLITGKMARMRDIDFEAELAKGYEFWPFEGEFWKDEIGGYAFATSDVCGEGGT